MRVNAYWQKKEGGKRKSERQVKELMWLIDLSFWVMAHGQSPDLTESSSAVLEVVFVWGGCFAFCFVCLF